MGYPSSNGACRQISRSRNRHYHRLGMHLRRALLLFAIVLGVAALAASLAPPPESTRQRTTPAPPPTTVTQPEAMAPPPAARTVRVSFDAAARRPAVQRVPAGDHVIVSVAALEPGQIGLGDFDLVADVGPNTPAGFDLLPTRPGRYPVTYRPSLGRERRVGTLAVVAG